jgi:hypothetical protein
LALDVRRLPPAMPDEAARRQQRRETEGHLPALVGEVVGQHAVDFARL